MIYRALLILSLSLCTLTACNDDAEEYSDNNGGAANNAATNNGNSDNNVGDGTNSGERNSDVPIDPNNNEGLNNGDNNSWNPNNNEGLNNDPNYQFCDYTTYEDRERLATSSCEGYAGQWFCSCGGNKLMPASDSDAENCQDALIDVCELSYEEAYSCEFGQGINRCIPGEEEGLWECTCEGSTEPVTAEIDACDQALESVCGDSEPDPDPGESCERREENKFCQCTNIGGDNWDCIYSFSCENMGEGGNGGGGGGSTNAASCQEALDTTCDEAIDCK